MPRAFIQSRTSECQQISKALTYGRQHGKTSNPCQLTVTPRTISSTRAFCGGTILARSSHEIWKIQDHAYAKTHRGTTAPHTSLGYKKYHNKHRQGHITLGQWTLKELQYQRGVSDMDSSSTPSPNRNCKHLWKMRHLPKITLFLWLLMKHKNLTWDNLQKRGFSSPSIYSLYMTQAKDSTHLFLTNSFTSLPWDHLAISFHRQRLSLQSIISTQENRTNSPFKNSVKQSLDPYPMLSHVERLERTKCQNF